jgi:hypothetical protein
VGALARRSPRHHTAALVAGSANVLKRIGSASLVVDPTLHVLSGLWPWFAPTAGVGHRPKARTEPFLTWRPGFSSYRKSWCTRPGGKPNHRWARGLVGKSPFEFIDNVHDLMRYL